ncbi:DUF2933 domain-containing protein [Streptomyces sp. NBC_00019]|uniref:DUF2933 domain-containing protein n=1 Tax=Streptomyces sp. NBC_00019 TaxID=2975623 RepID=UPI003245E6F7
MNTSRHDHGLYAIAVVGALTLDLTVATLAFLAIALACPLMTVFLMRGRHGGHDTSHESRPDDDPQAGARPAAPADPTARAPGNRSARCPL